MTSPQLQTIENVAVDVVAALTELTDAGYQASLSDQIAPLTLPALSDSLAHLYATLWDPTTPQSTMLFGCRRLVHMVVEASLETFGFGALPIVTPSGKKYEGVTRKDKIAAVTMMRNGEIISSILQSCCKGISIGHVLVTEGEVSHTTPVARLEDAGVPAADIAKLAAAGFGTADAVACAPRTALAAVPDLGADHAGTERAIAAAVDVVIASNSAQAFYAKFGSSVRRATKMLLLDLCINQPNSILKAIEVLEQHSVAADDITVVCLFISEPALLLIHRRYPNMNIVASGVYKSTRYSFSPDASREFASA